MVVGLLGIMKAGGAYVPLDPSFPKDRLAFMAADAQIPFLVTQQGLMHELPEHQAQVICVRRTKFRTASIPRSLRGLRFGSRLCALYFRIHRAAKRGPDFSPGTRQFPLLDAP